MTTFTTRLGVALSLCLACATGANAAALDLSRYSVSSAKSLNFAEASGITYNWDRNSLMVVGDEGTAMEYGLDGNPYPGVFDYLGISRFNDTEFVTYIGNGQYVMGNERTMQMATVAVQPDTVEILGQTRYFFGENLTNFSFSGGANVGNVGLEGVSYDPLTGGFFAVKENSPQGLYFVSDATGAGLTNPFSPTLLGLVTLSDIQVLSTVPSFEGTGYEGNLLILSQSSQKLLEVTRTGEILSSFDLSNVISDTGKRVTVIEGVTIDKTGTIYLAAELGGGATGSQSTLITLSAPAVPEPASWAMMIGGFALAGAALRRRQGVVRLRFAA